MNEVDFIPPSVDGSAVSTAAPAACNKAVRSWPLRGDSVVIPAVPAVGDFAGVWKAEFALLFCFLFPGN